MMKITGGCHCGNIGYEFSSELELAEFPVRICGCTFCSKHGNRYTSDPEGRLLITIERPEEVGTYRFASKTTDWMFCKICGVMPLIVMQADDEKYALINVNSADQPFDMTKAERFDYSAETVKQSVERRKGKWIGQVEIRNLK